MRVLVTRPRSAGMRTAARLSAMGHEALLFPLAEPLADLQAARAGLARSKYPIVITSAEAIQVTASLPEVVDAHRNRPVFAVGDASAAAARKAGFTQVTASQGAGSDLAEALARSSVDAVLYLAGCPRAEGFERSAAALSIKIDLAECYRMQPLGMTSDDLHRAIGGSVDAVLLYSGQTAKAFFAAAGSSADLRSARFLCLSAAVAAEIPLEWAAQVAVADAPDEDRLLALL